MIMSPIIILLPEELVNPIMMIKNVRRIECTFCMILWLIEMKFLQDCCVPVASGGLVGEFGNFFEVMFFEILLTLTSRDVLVILFG